jgi:thiamine biosynthesis lipoprotein ApbE
VDGAARVTKAAPSWIDVGGIAKGYAVDCAIAT